MANIDIARILAVQPLRDFESTPEKVKKIHRCFNNAYALFTVFLMVLLPVTKCQMGHSILDFAGDVMLWTLSPVAAMWIIGYRIQLLQSRDSVNQTNMSTHAPSQNFFQFVLNEFISNVLISDEYVNNEYVTNEFVTNEFTTNEFVSYHSTLAEPANDNIHPADSKESAGSGRPAYARFELTEGPLMDEFMAAALDEKMNEYDDYELHAADGRYILDAMSDSKFYKDQYTLESLAEWLYERYKVKFWKKMKSGLSMTTTGNRTYDFEKRNSISKSLESKYSKIMKGRLKNN